MSAKGNTMALNDKSLEVATFLTNGLLRKIEPEMQAIDTNMRKLEDSDFSGGRGDEIKKALESAKKSVDIVRNNILGISRFLDTKLGKVMEAIKDNDDIASTAEQIQRQVAESKLKKQ